MKEQEGIWVNKQVTSLMGDVLVCLRLDSAINPEVMMSKLEKEGEEIRKKMFKLLNKLDSLNDKTPKNIMDAVVNELAENQKLHGHYLTEYLRWSDALRLKIIEEAVIEASK